MCHERWALHVVIKRNVFYIYFTFIGHIITYTGTLKDADNTKREV